MTFTKIARPLCYLLIAILGAKASAADWPPEVTRYYKEGFTADKVPANVLAAVEAFDNHSLPFKELTYKQSGDARPNDAASTCARTRDTPERQR